MRKWCLRHQSEHAARSNCAFESGSLLDLSWIRVHSPAVLFLCLDTNRMVSFRSFHATCRVPLLLVSLPAVCYTRVFFFKIININLIQLLRASSFSPQTYSAKASKAASCSLLSPYWRPALLCPMYARATKVPFPNSAISPPFQRRRDHIAVTHRGCIMTGIMPRK